MSSTPPIPAEIRNLKVDGYTNVYQLVPNATRLFGTESLYGDWHAPLLLLAQDFSHANFVRERVANGVQDPYKHKSDLPTNKNLTELSHVARKAGALYGSALGPLLKESDGFGSSLPNRSDALRAATEILRFTVDNMPNLKAIVCLGTVAWKAVHRTYLRETIATPEFAPGGPPHFIEPRHIAVFVTAHTSPRGLNNRRESGANGRRGKQVAAQDWQAINQYLFPVPDP